MPARNEPSYIQTYHTNRPKALRIDSDEEDHFVTERDTNSLFFDAAVLGVCHLLNKECTALLSKSNTFTLST